jgi:hypothetical protein
MIITDGNLQATEPIGVLDAKLDRIAVSVP